MQVMKVVVLCLFVCDDFVLFEAGRSPHRANMLKKEKIKIIIVMCSHMVGVHVTH